MGRRGFGRRRRSTRNVAMSQPTISLSRSLPFSERQVRILRPVVQAFMRAVFHVRHDLAFGRPVGAQFVGDHTLWRHALFLQKSRQQALGRLVGALTVMGALLPQFPYRSINVTVPDGMQGRSPDVVADVLAIRQIKHSTGAIQGLMYTIGVPDPRNPRTKAAIG